ncbi:MAG: hypothetical protein NC305_09675 [Lachnospiraceae bacterium]|nr:hypothetical protein [Butyrivibrio sp.]MCM1343610.1 hypothetical protein [Muribaculaceae bacterium]MCM1410800.1 hypothetical protein [Lachnospiraceae bacterium]
MKHFCPDFGQIPFSAALAAKGEAEEAGSVWSLKPGDTADRKAEQQPAWNVCRMPFLPTVC